MIHINPNEPIHNEPDILKFQWAFMVRGAQGYKSVLISINSFLRKRPRVFFVVKNTNITPDSFNFLVSSVQNFSVNWASQTAVRSEEVIFRSYVLDSSSTPLSQKMDYPMKTKSIYFGLNEYNLTDLLQLDHIAVWSFGDQSVLPLPDSQVVPYHAVAHRSFWAILHAEMEN